VPRQVSCRKKESTILGCRFPGTTVLAVMSILRPVKSGRRGQARFVLRANMDTARCRGGARGSCANAHARGKHSTPARGRRTFCGRSTVEGEAKALTSLDSKIEASPRSPSESKWLLAGPAKCLDSSESRLGLVEPAFALLNPAAQHWRKIRVLRGAARGIASSVSARSPRDV
jgi:hypothetical protein